MLSLEEVLAQEFYTPEKLVEIEAKTSLNARTCIYCGFYNKNKFKAKSAMRDSELRILAMWEEINGPHKHVHRIMMPMKVNGFWARVCIDCAKNLNFKQSTLNNFFNDRKHQ